MKNKIIIFTLPIFGLNFLMAEQSLAVCPVCTIGVVAGVGLSRWLGIDDTISGLWIGGLIVSLIMWTISYLDSKKIRFKGRKIITVIGYYALVVLPLYSMGIMGNPLNACACGIDNLLIGMIWGSVAFSVGAIWYFYLKKKNNGHAYFPFQKVVMPISPLIILSIIFYFLNK